MSKLNIQKAAYLASYGTSAQLPPSERPEIVFSGRSNVGKSSLINKLCQRKNLARTSGTPGKTATINFFDLQEAYFVDLPGYGYAKTSHAERRRWDELINGYFSATRKLCVLVQLLDFRHKPSKDDIGMLEYLNHHRIPFVVALTKADKIKPAQRAAALEQFEEILQAYPHQQLILTSTEKNIGIEELKVCIENNLDQWQENL